MRKYLNLKEAIKALPRQAYVIKMKLNRRSAQNQIIKSICAEMVV